ncbi:MAG: hypothetical protein IH811_06700, partial [Proteobacteria bacterium]|nr:hypothetical protein [Pseudomonadota bacterium]
MKSYALFLAGLILAPALSHAAEMRSVSVDYDDGYYYLESDAWFDVGRK